MERHKWAPLIISGLFPRELPDALAMVIIGLAGAEAFFGPVRVKGYPLSLVIIPLVASSTCTLASLTNTSRKMKGEFALLAYGGSFRGVLAGNFVRGLTCSLLALSPFIIAEVWHSGMTFSPFLSTSLASATLGGSFYCGPAFRRLRPDGFAEYYKA